MEELLVATMCMFDFGLTWRDARFGDDFVKACGYHEHDGLHPTSESCRALDYDDDDEDDDEDEE